MFGANTDLLRRIAAVFDEQGSVVGSVGVTTLGEVEAVEWVGPDADNYRDDYRSAIAPQHRELEAILRGMRVELTAHADMQDAASDGSPYGTGGGQTGGAQTGGAQTATSSAGSSVASNGAAGRATGDLGPGGGAVGASQVASASASGSASSGDQPWPDTIEEDLKDLAANGTPEEVADYFDAMGLDPADPDDAAKLRELGETYPDLIGNLEGAPYTARDAANRVRLDNDIAELEAITNDPDAPWGEKLRAEDQLKSLYALKRNIGEEYVNDKEGHMLAEYHKPSHISSMPVRAGVSSGNLDTAESITVFVSGMDSSVLDIGSLIGSGDAVREAAAEAGTGNVEDYASYALQNYYSPSVLDVHRNDAAEKGAENLQDDLAGLNAARGDDDYELNIVAFSYGTNVVHHALTGVEDAFGVDNIFYVGSAGLPEGENYDYGDANQYVTEHDGDITAQSGRGWGSHHPVDPRELAEFETYDSTKESADAYGTSKHTTRGDGGYFFEDDKGKSTTNVDFIAEKIA